MNHCLMITKKWLTDLKKRILITLLFLLVHLVPLFSQAEPDDLVYSIDTVDVSASKNISPLRGSGTGQIILNMDYLESLPKFMGNTDPLGVARMLPGVRTSNEYDGRLNIDGGGNEHNVLSLSGVPLYNVNHLLGFFSTFIPSHYESMSLSLAPNTAQSPNRIGGELVFYPAEDSIAGTLSGELSVGLLSTQGTVKVPIGRHSILTLSLRDSYINLLYSKWLNTEGLNMNYSFFDSNITWTCYLNDRNTLTADAYWGADKVQFDNDTYLADIGFKWGNNAEALHWTHKNRARTLILKQTLYRTEHRNRFEIRHEDLSMNMPTGITDYGYMLKMNYKQLSMGGVAMSHTTQIQSPVIAGTYKATKMKPEHQNNWECSAYVDYTCSLSDLFSLTLGVRGNFFFMDKSSFRSIDPSMTIAYRNEDNGLDISLNLTQRHQNLFQTGVTDYGLPIEFWFTANKDHKPQYMRGLTLSGSAPLFNGGYSLSASAYYRLLYNQLDYYGSLIDFLSTDYSLYDHLIKGEGRNYGVDVMLTKNTGNLLGWISYSYGRALRNFSAAGVEGWYPARHERRHELDLLLTYKTGKRWEPSCTFVAADGTPFTAPEYFYLINYNVFARYGEYNANRLRPYMRMDLSVNIELNHRNRSFIKEHGLSVSAYNVLCRNNDISYQMKIYDDKIYYNHISFVSTVLPTISYYCKF